MYELCISNCYQDFKEPTPEEQKQFRHKHGHPKGKELREGMASYCKIIKESVAKAVQLKLLATAIVSSIGTAILASLSPQ